MLLSYSGRLVLPKKGGEFCCDSNFPNWRAMGAVAEVNKKLPQLQRERSKCNKVVDYYYAEESWPMCTETFSTCCYEMSVTGTSTLETPSPSTVTCHAHEGGMMYMPGPGSPHEMVQTPVQSPLNFYIPYPSPSQAVYPPFQPNLRQDAGNPHPPAHSHQLSNKQPPLPFILCFIINGNISVFIGYTQRYLNCLYEEW